MDTQGLGNYNGNAITTGCYDEKECYLKTEILDMTTMTWSDANDYPYSTRFIIEKHIKFA